MLPSVEHEVGAGELRTADQSACEPMTGGILTQAKARDVKPSVVKTLCLEIKGG